MYVCMYVCQQGRSDDASKKMTTPRSVPAMMWRVCASRASEVIGQSPINTPSIRSSTRSTILMEQSVELERRMLPSSVKRRSVMSLECILISFTSPVSGVIMLILPSDKATASFPVFETRARAMGFLNFARDVFSPVSKSQVASVWSMAYVKSVRWVGSNSIPTTLSSCSFRTCLHVLFSTSQIRTVVSLDAVMT